ncbi:ABC transporter substrate-binding protein [Brevibacillus reuszeri]|uniref:ABC transporter substrate-binding protein n=1 Tax=Brevibacillus reuszeri TaxID=54915 RepID=UPI00289EAB1C|nr:ABC transporter substrate-binding protein [Brevibacillus reuszeri]
MNNIRNIVGAVGTIVLATSLLFGCSSQTSQKQESAPSSAEAATRSYTDYKGHTSPIPVSPQRIIFWGETFGDTLALGVKPVGGSGYTNQVFEDRLQDVEDVGFPINLEKVLELKPDVILYAGTDEKDFDALSKIAPTVIFDTFAPLEERMTLLGDLIMKKEEAKKWLKEYKQSAESMWKKLKETGMKEGETASVFTYYPGDRLFVMARTGLSQVLYDENGFKPTPPIKEVLGAEKGFELVSLERLPEFAGDRIFILNPTNDEPKRSTEALLKSRIWNELPAVKNGHVYFIDIEKASADATTREWLLKKIPEMLLK